MVPVESARGSSARRLEQLLGLLQLDSGERRERLRRIGRADPAAGAALEDLLAHHAAAMADGFLGDSPGQGDAPEGWIGPYQVVRELGHGGMGTVYLARRHEPYRQDVALKRMRPGLPEHLRSRFDAERQILATLIHPGIVRLLDGGTDADGSPYLVMEYVEGARLDEHCRERARGREERVRLVHAVAEAVAHAHRQGTVHRDLKPSNVLVGADGRPRVTDFGLAKLVATAAGGASATLTEAGLLLGTPPYMAPERLGLGPGRDEPGVDVYALGVMLFGLLVDRLPFESDDPLDGCVRAAREEAPPPRQVDPTVPRDLETITSRALARDPRDRFIDAGELAEQLRRYLAGEPLTIRPPSRAERLARWASRHRPALLASATSAGVVLVAAIVVLMAWNRDLHREQDALRSTIRSLWRSSARLFESVPPHNPAVRSFHDELARSFDAVLASGQLPAEPSLARQVAVMHRQLATSLEASGRSAEALEHLDRSIALLRPLPGRTDGGMVRAWTEFDLFRSLSRRSVILGELGGSDAALADSDEALAMIRGLVDRFPADPAWREALARHLLERKPLFERLGRPADAARAAVEAVDWARQAAGLAPDGPTELNTLLTALIRLAEVPALEADRERHLREALEVADRLERLPGGGDWSTRDARVLALSHLGRYYLDRGRGDEAAPFYEEAVEVLDELIALSPESSRFRDFRRWVGEALARCRRSVEESEAGPPR